VQVTHESRIDSLLEHLGGKRDLTLVFVRTKHGADKLVKKLSHQGVAAVAMHGNKTQRQRERALAQFESFDVDTLVATDVAARGIDVSGISHVINFDPPHDSETYVHRIGRTGRAGATGIGITLVSPDQHRDVAQIATELGLEHGLPAGRPSVAAGGFRRGPKPGAPSQGAPRQGGHRQNGGGPRNGTFTAGRHGHDGQRSGKPAAARHGRDSERPGGAMRQGKSGRPQHKNS
jgi:superfamily II DNA/RNA helicase